ncbi:hypothetical protein HMPREF0299_5091 [Corynebacterium matruchotii ATCC 14266]|uniref:Uncharacterized protein n=1 Tax=Corynebacterium matruchotii ATCC 14266 TaxID=553207 RepID=E0DHD9_9CORY|nr:hypothetical protein HMPREF0299_5091 [Corynebacterium matruchotii ATCC 14266]
MFHVKHQPLSNTTKPQQPTTPINHHVSRETIAITKSRKENRK